MVLFGEMKRPVPVPGAAVARPPQPISAAGRRHGGAASALHLLGQQGAVKTLGQNHILCYVCSLETVPWESVTSNGFHRGPSPSALGLEGCSARPRLALRRLLTREAWCELEVTPQPFDKFVDRAEVCSIFVQPRPSRRRGSAAGIAVRAGGEREKKNL